MLGLKEKYIIDVNGNKTAVIIDIKDYDRLMTILGEYEEFDSQNVNYDIARGLKDVVDEKCVSVAEFFGEAR